jgi:hypothetical protein
MGHKLTSRVLLHAHHVVRTLRCCSLVRYRSLVALPKPFLCPATKGSQPRCIPYIRVVGCLRGKRLLTAVLFFS